MRSFIDADNELIAPSPDVIKMKTSMNNDSPIDRSKLGQPFDNTVSEFSKQDKTPINKKKNIGYVLTPLTDSPAPDETPASEDGTKEDSDDELPMCKVCLRR